MIKKLVFVVIPFLFACGAAKKVSVLSVSTPLAADAPVEVIGIGQKVAEGSKLLGQIKIGESGMTASKNCTYDAVIKQAQSEARTLGGNLIQITEHKEPNLLITSCHRIKCDVYKKQ